MVSCSAAPAAGLLSESVYGRTWHAARAIALGPGLVATPLARRPYDLRHAALSLWLNAGGEPAEVAARAGNSVHVLLTVYTHCIHDHDQFLNQHIANRPPALSCAASRPYPAACTRHAPRGSTNAPLSPPSCRT